MPKLYVVATPIGNLDDLTPRMRFALEQADLIAAEDTRVTMKLLNRFELKKPMISCHRHNEENRAPQLVARMLEEDLTVALTCDAGTPGISDPGHLLVRAAWEAGVCVEPVSGPTAVATCLSVSGFDAREFAFFGFLPREKKALHEKLKDIRKTGVDVFVLYESPHRVVELVNAIAEEWAEARVCVCSDLTKKFERIYRGTAGAVAEEIRANPNADKGEYCMAVDLLEVPKEEEAPRRGISAEMYLLSRMLDGVDFDEAVEEARKKYPRNELYRAKLKIEKMFFDE